MTVPPLPALIAGSILLGWPLIQIVSVLLAKPMRSRMRQLADDLRAEFAGDDIAHKVIRRTVRASHGDAIFCVLPVFLPLAMIAFSLTELFSKNRSFFLDSKRLEEENDRLAKEAIQLKAQIYPEEKGCKVYENHKFKEMNRLSGNIEFIRWPVAVGLTAITTLPFLPILILAAGFREALEILPQLALKFVSYMRVHPQNI